MSSRLSARDIEEQEFSRKMRGLDPDEVRLFLRSTGEEVERLHLENGRLLEETGRLKTEVEELRSRESTLQNTLVSAQSMTDDMKQKAREQAELIVGKARLEADRLIAESQERMAGLEKQIGDRKLEMELFEQRIRSAIDEHLLLLDRRSDGSSGRGRVHLMPNRSHTELG